MKRTILLFLTAISALTGFAVNISADKLYTMSNRNDNSLYVKDTGDDILKMGALDNKCYWRFIPTGTDGQYYVQNVATGRYAQECSTATEVNVTMGTKPVAYSIKDCSSAEGTDCFGLTSANEAVLDFTAGAVGWNWKNDNTVQTFCLRGRHKPPFVLENHRVRLAVHGFRASSRRLLPLQCDYRQVAGRQ